MGPFACQKKKHFTRSMAMSLHGSVLLCPSSYSELPSFKSEQKENRFNLGKDPLREGKEKWSLSMQYLMTNQSKLLSLEEAFEVLMDHNVILPTPEEPSWLKHGSHHHGGSGGRPAHEGPLTDRGLHLDR